jgi:NAD-dependent dihydropyrimidine dehydrogenase PreA subunit
MRYLLNGQSLALDAALCNGCGRCEEVCPHAVFAVANRKAAIVHREECMECGACRMNCATGAIAVSSGVGCASAVIGAMRRGNCAAANCNCGCG